MIRKLSHIPLDGQFEEIFFDLDDSWRGKDWHFAIFTTSDGQEWCGHFRQKNGQNFLISELQDKNLACIVSGEHGYLIDIDKKEKIKDIECENIVSLIADDISSSFIFTSYYDLIRVRDDLSENKIELPIQSDGVFFNEIKDRKLFLEIEEIGADMIRNKDYYLDLIDWKIKKHRA